jgi:DNA mismatch endonuclease (patch repair protein)
MTDVHTKTQRSYNMSRIRSKWTEPERIIHNYLKGRKVKHQMHPNIFGRPDILLLEKNIIVFLDGCFWHKCPNCFHKPSTNRKFWVVKIDKNVQKDMIVNRKLVSDGWRVVRIWEHEIRINPENVATKLISMK